MPDITEPNASETVNSGELGHVAHTRRLAKLANQLKALVNTGRLSEEALGTTIATTVEGVADDAADASVARRTRGAAIDLQRGVLTPDFERVANNLITQPESGLTTLYWPWCIRVEDKIDSPLGSYYLYYSTDHDNGAGGIAMAYADHPEGPWTVHGVVYTDTVSGRQTETPSVMWNEDTELFHMYYQQDLTNTPSNNQRTMLATSPNGTTWTRVGIAINGNPSASAPHTGYLKPFRVGEQWVGYHLLAGGDYGIMGMSWSHDGINWYTDPRPLGYDLDLTGVNTLRVEWHSANVFEWLGKRWMLFSFRQFVSGVGVSASTPMVAPLRDDLRGFAAKPVPTSLDVALPGESSVGGAGGNFVTHDGVLYSFYTSRTTPRSFGVLRSKAV